MNIAALLLSFLVAQLDLSKVTKDDIVKTVEHMQRLNHELMDKLAVVEKENHGLKLESIKAKQSLREADDSAFETKIETAKVQVSYDREVKRAEKAESGERKAWSWWRWSAGVNVLMALAIAGYIAWKLK